VISDALAEALANDATVIAALGAYEFTDGVPEPAIFTDEVIPEPCEYPAVIIDDAGGTPWGDRCKRGGATFCRVRIYGDKDRALDIVRDAAWAINRALDRADLNSYLEGNFGYHAMLCQADPPAYLPDPDGFPGYVVGVRVVVMEL